MIHMNNVAPNNCSVVIGVGQVCGAAAVVSWVNSRGEAFAECAEHCSGPAPSPQPEGAGMVGRHVVVHCFSHPVRCEIVSVGRSRVQVVGQMANGRVVRRHVPIADIQAGHVPFV